MGYEFMNKTISFLGDRVTYTGIANEYDWTAPSGVSLITYLVAASMSMDKDIAKRVLIDVLRNFPWLTIYTPENIKVLQQCDYNKRMKTLWSSA
jgi:hypothetical protein